MVRAQLLGIAVVFTIIVTQLAGCANPSDPSKDQPKLQELTGHTMGTTYSMKWPASYELEPAQIKSNVTAALNAVNQQMSTYINDSELSRFNQAKAPVSMEVSSELAQLVQQSIDLHAYTKGYFDVSIGPLVNIWGFGPDDINTNAPDDVKIRDAKAKVGIEAISVAGTTVAKNADRYIDLSAIAKGYGVDKLADIMEHHGVQHYLVEIGGEIRTKGQKAEGKPWRIAIEKPDAVGRSVHKVLAMPDTGMATSGDYRNYFEVDGERFSHTINPNTGRPTRHKLASVTVFDPSCARADALATAMLVMGETKAQDFAKLNKIPAYFIIREGEGFKTSQSPSFDSWLNQ